MKRIQIKELALKNFKGIKSLHLTNLGKETFILGANGAGKTTVFDAFIWLLFGKDSTDRTNFEIKTLDENNNVIHKLEHEVSAILDVNGDEVKLQRIFKEKWVKKRASLEAEFAGNETLYFWNEVPHTLRDYSAKVNDIIDESVFKLITSPYAFNALKWQDQREALVNMIGDVTEESIAQENPRYAPVMQMKGNNTIAELQTQIKASIRKSKEELKTIPTRIDEVDRNTPEPLNWTQIESDLNLAKKQVEKLDDQISDRLKAHEEESKKLTEKQDEIHSLKRKNAEISFFVKQEAEEEVRKNTGAKQELESELERIQSLLQKASNLQTDFESQIKSKQIAIDDYETQITSKRNEWAKVNAEEFVMNEEDTACDACHREFESDKVEELKAKAKENFDADKKRRLKRITEEGKTLGARKTSLQSEINELEERKEKATEQIANLTAQIKFTERKIEQEIEKTKNLKTADEIAHEKLANHAEIKVNLAKISELEQVLGNRPEINYDDLKAKKQEANELVSNLQSQLAQKQQVQLSELRKQELIEEESKLSEKIVEMEKTQFLIEELTKEKITRLESQINSRFEFVKFKLFETQVNGAEVETCKALINGVPFSDANTASKINAGLDIINTLSAHYAVVAPVFIDNRESVTKLIESESQIINLVVSPEDKTLRVVTK